MLLEERVAGHHHPGATAALQAVLGHEAFLERMQRAVLGRCPSTVMISCPGLDGEHRARLHRAAVQEDGAGPAVRRVAPDVGAGQPQRLPDEMDKQEPGLDVSFVFFPLIVSWTSIVNPS